MKQVIKNCLKNNEKFEVINIVKQLKLDFFMWIKFFYQFLLQNY